METATMRTKIPNCRSGSFSFKTMFRTILATFTNQVMLPMSVSMVGTPAQRKLIISGNKGINLATALVLKGHNDEVAMKMLAMQADCQEGLESFCRYEYDYISIRTIAYNEMFLNYMKVVIELVDLVSYWYNTDNHQQAKQSLADMGELMANCNILLRFTNVPLNCINHGTLPELMPLIRFQNVSTKSLNASIVEELQDVKARYQNDQSQLQEARRIFLLYHEQFIRPLRQRLKNIYQLEVAKYN